MIYKKIVEYKYQPSEPKEILRDSVQYHCRFCNEVKTADNFKKIAHAVAESVGNTHIISEYECDTCNGKFSKYEKELGNLFLLYRADRNLPKKRGKVSHYGQSQITYNKTTKTFQENLNLRNNPYDFILLEERSNNQLALTKGRKIKVNFQYVYLALLKFALSIVPEKYIQELDDAFNVLRGDQPCSYGPVAGIIWKDNIEQPGISLFKEVGEKGFPHFFAAIDIFQVTYYIFLNYSGSCINYLPVGIIIDELHLDRSRIYSSFDCCDMSNKNQSLPQIEQIIGNVSIENDL